MTNTLPPTGENWEEQFDQMFGIAWQMDKDGSHLVTEVSYVTTDRIKDFISSLLADQTKRVRVDELELVIREIESGKELYSYGEVSSQCRIAVQIVIDYLRERRESLEKEEQK